MSTGAIKKRGWKLLWTNPSPSSNFAAQTVSLDLSNYTQVEIVFSHDGLEYTHTCIITIGYGGSSDYFTTYQNSIYPKRRNFTTSSTGISFSDDKEFSTVKNDQNKPLLIYAQ